MRAGRPFHLGVGRPNNLPEQGGGAVERGRGSGGAVAAGGGAARSFSTDPVCSGSDPKQNNAAINTIELCTVHWFDRYLGKTTDFFFYFLSPACAGRAQTRGYLESHPGTL